MAKPDFFFYTRGQGVMTGDVQPDFDTYNVHNVPCPGVVPKAAGQIEFNVSAQSYTDCWVSFYARAQGPGAQQDDRPIAVIKGATTELLRVATTGADGDTKFQYWNGSAWVTIGSALGTDLDQGGLVFTRFDIHCKLHGSTGEFKVYADGVDKATLSGNTIFTADTTANGLIFRSMHGSFTSFYGHIFVDSVDTRGLFIDAALPSSDGTYAEWNGGAAQCDDILWNPTSDYAGGDTHGKRMLLNFPSISAVYSGYAVEGVVIAFVAQAVSEPAFYLKPITRVASDYAPAGSVRPTSTRREGYGLPLDNNPATGAPWASQAAVNGQQMGLIVSNTA